MIGRRSDRIQRPQPRPERGAVLVEMALVGMLLALICMGLIELGFAWKDSISIEQASRLAARAGSSQTGSDRADQQLAQALVAALEPGEYNQVDYVVVWDAGASEEVPTSCRTASQATLCNHFTKAMLDQAADDDLWGCGGSAYDQAWCPGNRDSTPESPTYIGVLVSSHRDWMTGFFPGAGLDFEADTTMALVPADY